MKKILAGIPGFFRDLLQYVWPPVEVMHHRHLGVFRRWYCTFVIYLRFCALDFWNKNCLTAAAALAYTLLFALIPLIASLSIAMAKFMEDRSSQIQDMVLKFLPYTSETLNQGIQTFVRNAQTIQGIGIFALFFTVISLFGTVESAFNNIFGIRKSRPVFKQVQAFTLILVYMPLFFYLSYKVRSLVGFSLKMDVSSTGYLSRSLSGALFSICAFTALYKTVPNTVVKLRNALLGGLVAGLFYEAAKFGFQFYVKRAISYNTIYGSLGLIPLFLFSLYLLSVVIFLGIEICYVSQNFRAFVDHATAKDRRRSINRLYILYRILLDVLSRFKSGRDPVSRDDLLLKYNLTEYDLNPIIQLLLDNRLLLTAENQNNLVYIPARPAEEIAFSQVVEIHYDRSTDVQEEPDDEARKFFIGIMEEYRNSMQKTVSGLSLAAILEKQKHEAAR